MNVDKALGITLVIFGIVLIIAFAARPAIINFYFDHQATHSINETRIITAAEGYGKVLVMEGEIYYVTNDYFTATDSNGQVVRAYLTDKLNCIPEPGSIKKIAGAWNPTNINYDQEPGDVGLWAKENGFNNITTGLSQENFYAVWIIDGCEKP